MTRAKLLGGDLDVVVELHRARQQKQAAIVPRQRSLEQRIVEPRDVLGHVLNRVIGNDVEPDVGIAEGEIEIDDDDAVLLVAGQNAAQVDRQRRAAHAAAGAGDGDHLARADLPFARPRHLRLPDALEGRQNVFELQRQAQELLGPVAHGLQDQAPLGGRADDQHVAVGKFLRDPGDQRQPFGRVGIERHQGDIGPRLHDHVEEEIVARALGLEPDRVDAEHQRLERRCA